MWDDITALKRHRLLCKAMLGCAARVCWIWGQLFFIFFIGKEPHLELMQLTGALSLKFGHTMREYDFGPYNMSPGRQKYGDALVTNTYNIVEMI